MKRLISLSLALIILLLNLTACGGKVSANAKKYGYFCFPGTDWGMTLEEVSDSLGKKTSDFQKVEETELDELGLENKNTDIATSTWYKTNMKVFDDTVDVYFCFSSGYLVEEESLFETKYILYCDKEKWENICDNIEKMITSQDIAFTTGESDIKDKGIDIDDFTQITKSFSSIQVKEMDKSALKEINTYYQKVAETYSDIPTLKNPLQAEGVKAPLSKAKVTYTEHSEVSGVIVHFTAYELRFLHYKK